MLCDVYLLSLLLPLCMYIRICASLWSCRVFHMYFIGFVHVHECACRWVSGRFRDSLYSLQVQGLGCML